MLLRARDLGSAEVLEVSKFENSRTSPDPSTPGDFLFLFNFASLFHELRPLSTVA